MSLPKRKKPNRLLHEKSPYLLQHAYNPVDWWPWCEEAFRKAQREDKPVFLSVGYSSCHWCHVMERESFEDREVARLLNETFVCIKVDREERPDIDAVYLTVCQLLTGHGGWPLTILMTPDGKPFFAATYLPKEGRFGRLGLKELAERVRDLWAHHREELLRSAEKTTQTLRRLADPLALAPEGSPPGEGLLHRAYEQLRSQFDEAHGGFGTAPKFPLPSYLRFLLRYADRFSNREALSLVEKTLSAMRAGGIYDQLGFGFHRYSTDAEWKLPHFEKMLYDQALLSLTYLEAYQATGREEFAQTAREVFQYVLRDLTSPEGAFYTAEDADSEGREGRFYTWTYEELFRALSPEDAELAVEVFGVSPEGNFAEEATGRRTGANVLYFPRPLSEVAQRRGLPESRLRERVERVREALFRAREGRVRPLKDDKVLTDINGLMIAALSVGARVLEEPAYAEAAERAAGFLREELRDPQGQLLHRYREGEAAVPGFLDDYAFLAWGLLELYQTTFRVEHLREALRLGEAMIERFWDEKGTGFYFTAAGTDPPLGRRKELYDGATPSGNAVALEVLLRLGSLTGRTDFLERADRLLRSLRPSLEASPLAHTHALLGLDFSLGPTVEIVIVGERDRADTQAFLHAIHRRFLPRCAVLLRSPQDGELVELAPFVESMGAGGDRATAYVCRGQSCSAPVTSAPELRRLLGNLWGNVPDELEGE